MHGPAKALVQNGGAAIALSNAAMPGTATTAAGAVTTAAGAVTTAAGVVTTTAGAVTTATPCRCEHRPTPTFLLSHHVPNRRVMWRSGRKVCM